MEYREKQVLSAFALYTQLSVKGELRKSEASIYFEDDDVRGLLHNYAEAVKCAIVDDQEYLYLLPLALESPFHISNDSFKKEYLTAKSVNMDIYLMYLAIIILFGCFYDSYQSQEPLEFVAMERWLTNMDSRIASLSQHDDKQLQAMENELNFNWVALLRKWTDLDGIKETAKKQDARTNSRLSFLNMTKDFLVSQKLVIELGNQELGLTEKAKTIISHYYMDTEYNRGIMDFMYSCDRKHDEGDENNAVHQ